MDLRITIVHKENYSQKSLRLVRIVFILGQVISNSGEFSTPEDQSIYDAIVIGSGPGGREASSSPTQGVKDAPKSPEKILQCRASPLSRSERFLKMVWSESVAETKTA